jgi:nicotinate-nucleotide adenylyltransferase
MRCGGRVLAAADMARIGLLGGSFNPAHSAHRRISLAAIETLGLDEVWWLVSPGNPLKEGAKDMAPFDARIASAVAMARRAWIRVSDVEQREGTRFTIDTVRLLKRRYPRHRFVWLLGSDTLGNFHKWRDWRGLAREVPIAVIPRPGYDSSAHAARAMGWLRRFVRPSSQARKWTEWSAPAILLLRLPRDPTSATAIRAHDPNWHRRTNARVARSSRLGSPMSPRRPLDRTSR